MSRLQRVLGHTLDANAGAHDEHGQPLPPVGRNGKAIGRAKCSCGELSPDLESGPARTAWHRDHKLDVLAERIMTGAPATAVVPYAGPKRFGRLTVVEVRAVGDRRGHRASCRCDCGETADVRLTHLRTGQTKSCGCLRMEGGVRR
jgi:hypothetical protein